MSQVVTGWDHLFGPWLAQKVDGDWQAGRGHIIGLFDPDKGIKGAAWFTDWNGASVVVHLAGEGKNWATREFLWFCSYYAFEQLGVNKVIAPVDSGNWDSRRWCEKFGYTLEATLKDACPKGNDMLIYTITKDQCKWLSLKGRYRGKTEGSSSA